VGDATETGETKKGGRQEHDARARKTDCVGFVGVDELADVAVEEEEVETVEGTESEGTGKAVDKEADEEAEEEDDDEDDDEETDGVKGVVAKAEKSTLRYNFESMRTGRRRDSSTNPTLNVN
jgi:hypothetical protein